MITNTDDFCTWLYVVVDDLWQQIAPLVTRPGPRPTKCSDSELITLAILGECWGWEVETELLANFGSLLHLFPNLPERSRFNRRRRNLLGAINAIRQLVVRLLDLANDNQCVIDSLPLIVIEFNKAHHAASRSYWSSYQASYGKVASKKQTIFGYKLHLLVTLNGLILDFELASANHTDLSVGLELLNRQSELLVLGDKGYISQTQKQLLAQNRKLDLVTLARDNQKEQPTKLYRKLHNHFRQIIETVNAQLASQFKIERTYAKSFWGLCARLHTKLAGHTLLIYFNRWLGKPDFLKIKWLAFPN